MSNSVDEDLSFFCTERYKRTTSLESLLQSRIFIDSALDFIEVNQIHAGWEMEETNLFEGYGGLEISNINILKRLNDTEVLIIILCTWSELGHAVLVLLTFATVERFLADVDSTEICLHFLDGDDTFWLIVHFIIHFCVWLLKKIKVIDEIILLITNL